MTGTVNLKAILVQVLVTAACVVGALVYFQSHTTPSVPGGDKTREEDNTDLINRLEDVRFLVQRLDEKLSAKPAESPRMEQIFQRVDELGSQIYSLGTDTQRSLMTLQQNILRKIAEIQTTAAPPQAALDPEALKESLAKDGIVFFASSRMMKIDGRVVSPDRPIEVAAAAPGGPMHESLFLLNCKPAALRRALLALDAKPGRGADYHNGTSPTGSEVFIYVTWEGLTKPWRLEDLIVDLSVGHEMRGGSWVFSGSEDSTDFKSGKEFYIPDVTGVAVGLTWNFSDSSVITSNHPKASNENIWGPNVELFPEVDELAVTFIISTVRQEAYERERVVRPDSAPSEDK